jgi:phage-related protein
MEDKPITWIGSSRDDLRDFPQEARRKAGFQLRALQRGEHPTNFKPMSSVGAGVEEIRIQTGDAFRVFYVARFEEAVYVLHAFQKKTQKTAKKDLDLGRRRYMEMLRHRQEQTEQ